MLKNLRNTAAQTLAGMGWYWLANRVRTDDGPGPWKPPPKPQ